MTASSSNVRRVALVAAAAIVAMVTSPLRATEAPMRRAAPTRAVDPAVTPVDPETVTAMTAEVSIRRTRVGEDGRPRGGAMPAVRYRIERTRTATGWRSTLRRLERQRPIVRTSGGEVALDQASPVSHVEDAGDGTTVRVFNDRGVEIRPPSKSRLRALASGEPGALRSLGLPERAGSESAAPAEDGPASKDPLMGLVYPGRTRGARRAAIRQRLGAAVERVRGLDRHIVRRGDELQETLVDPDAAVPVEVTVTREGVTVERLRHEYAGLAGGGLLRRAVRSERSLPGGGDRLVVEVEFSGLRVDVGGVR